MGRDLDNDLSIITCHTIRLTPILSTPYGQVATPVVLTEDRFNYPNVIIHK